MYIDKLLCCPQCGRHNEVVLEPDLGQVEQAFCRSCNHRLQVHDGVPNFAEHVPLIDPNLSPAQKVMNSRFFAAIYESPIWRPLHTRIGSGKSMEEELDEVLALSDASGRGAVADLACGTGHYARAFARRLPGVPVYGVDISPGMLVQGLKLARAEGLRTILFLRGDIHRLPFASASLDRVNCSGALHLFSNLAPIWEEVSRILRPGGVFSAMTIARMPGLIGRLQQSLVQKGRATFFDPEQLAIDLRKVNLSSFKHLRHRVTLLFSVAKEG